MQLRAWALAILGSASVAAGAGIAAQRQPPGAPPAATTQTAAAATRPTAPGVEITAEEAARQIGRLHHVRVAGTPVRVFSDDPQHLWNRLHRALWIRTVASGNEFGHDRLDALLWHESDYLYKPPAYTKIKETLEEFLRTGGEKQVRDPLKRAILQRDAWQIFDHVATHRSRTPDHAHERQTLRKLLAQLIGRVALSAEEIRTLQNTYAAAVKAHAFPAAFSAEAPAAAYLPAEFEDPKGPWVIYGANGAGMTPAHDAGLPRSEFMILLNLPPSRKATIDYLERMTTAASKAAGERRQDTPEQIPDGTQVALLRRMMLVDTSGSVHITGIVENVQIRMHRTADGDESRKMGFRPVEFVLSREALFAGKAGGLRAMESDEGDMHNTFQAHLYDQLSATNNSRPAEKLGGNILKSCMGCHNADGVHSFLSLENQNRRRQLIPDAGREWHNTVTFIRVHERYKLGLLQGMLAR